MTICNILKRICYCFLGLVVASWLRSLYVFEDGEDRESFLDLDEKCYYEYILPLKHKQASEFRFDSKLRKFSYAGRKRLGAFLSRATQLKEVTADSLDEELSLIFRGPFEKHSLEKFRFHAKSGQEPLSVEAVSSIAVYLSNAPALKELSLRSFKFDIERTGILSLALSKAKRRKLLLIDCRFDEGTFATFLHFLDTAKLEYLSLSGCVLDLNAFCAVWSTIADKDSVVMSLDVDLSARWISEIRRMRECLRLIKTIHCCSYTYYLPYHDESCLKQLDMMLFDSSCIHGVIHSNHVLRFIRPPIYEHQVESATGQTKQHLVSIKESLVINASRCNTKLRCLQKIVRYLTLGGKFNSEPFESVPLGLMPHVVEFLGRESNYPECCKWNGRRVTSLDGLFHLFCRFPFLCGHPSPEKLRFTAVVNMLRKENDQLRSENKRLTNGSSVL